jgi:hypothetical protein
MPPVDSLDEMKRNPGKQQPGSRLRCVGATLLDRAGAERFLTEFILSTAEGLGMTTKN